MNRNDWQDENARAATYAAMQARTGRTKLEPGATWMWAPDGEEFLGERERVTLVRKIEAGDVAGTALEDDDAAKWTVKGPEGDTFDVYERELLPMPHSASPEVTGRYECPFCGNTEDFRGVDEACGAYQNFDVDEYGEEEHDVYDPWDIGAYTEIQCQGCERAIWNREIEGALIEVALMDDRGLRTMTRNEAEAYLASVASGHVWGRVKDHEIRVTVELVRRADAFIAERHR